MRPFPLWPWRYFCWPWLRIGQIISSFNKNHFDLPILSKSWSNSENSRTYRAPKKTDSRLKIQTDFCQFELCQSELVIFRGHRFPNNAGFPFGKGISGYGRWPDVFRSWRCFGYRKGKLEMWTFLAQVSHLYFLFLNQWLQYKFVSI